MLHQRHKPDLSTQPVVLSRIELQRVRGIASLVLELAPPAADSGQWTVVLGPNGAGKTTLLRAAALALRDLKNPKIWPKGTFETPWATIGTSAGRSAIHIHTASSGRTKVIIERNGAETPRQERRADFSPLFAYGCHRGSTLGGAARAINLSEDDGPKIATLFDEGGRTQRGGPGGAEGLLGVGVLR